MPLPNFTVKRYKDGREVASFRDTQGRVRTRNGPQNWTRLGQMRELADYGIILQLQQAAAGLGSDGQPMPPLKRPQKRFAVRRDGVAQFSSRTVRTLYGTGKQGGHMLDFIRVNYLDDKKATITISSKVQRDKARGNEKRSPWWGWSPLSVRKLREKCAQLFGTGAAERLFELGIIGASALAFARLKSLRRAA